MPRGGAAMGGSGRSQAPRSPLSGGSPFNSGGTGRRKRGRPKTEYVDEGGNVWIWRRPSGPWREASRSRPLPGPTKLEKAQGWHAGKGGRRWRVSCRWRSRFCPTCSLPRSPWKEFRLEVCGRRFDGRGWWVRSKNIPRPSYKTPAWPVGRGCPEDLCQCVHSTLGPTKGQPGKRLGRGPVPGRVPHTNL